MSTCSQAARQRRAGTMVAGTTPRAAASVGPWRAWGVSYTELLIVLVVLAVLIGLLLPGIARVRHQSRMAQCAAGLKGFVNILAQYGNDHAFGALPTGDAEQGQAKPQNNLWDVPGKMLDVLSAQYALKRKITVCPEVSDFQAFLKGADEVYNQWNAKGVQGVLGYGYWVPRIGTGTVGKSTVFPPPPDKSNPYYHYSPDPNVRPLQGPRTLTSPEAVTVPVLSDAIFANFDSTEYGIGDPSYPTKPPSLASGLSKFATHMWNGAADFQNRAYIDGRVERVKVSELRPTYNLKYYSPYQMDGNSYPSWNWQ